MVFGNLGGDSGTGVAFTRDPSTGEKGLYGEYLAQAQGEDVVAGIRTPLQIAALREAMPAIYRGLESIAAKLEGHYRDMQDMEFTIEAGEVLGPPHPKGKKEASDPLSRIEQTIADARMELMGPAGLAWISRLGPEAFVIKTDEGRWVEFEQYKEDLRAGGSEHPVELRLKVILTRTDTSPED